MSTLLNLVAPRRFAALLIVAAALAAPVSAHATSNIPAQYIARMYTEALGRAPDAPDWSTWTTYFGGGNCQIATLKNMGTGSTGFFNSAYTTYAEFIASNPDPQSQVVSMYRAILNRDPDSKGFPTYFAILSPTEGGADTAANILTVANDLYNSTEFANLANAICGSYYSDSDYNPDTYIPDYNNPTLLLDPNNPEFPIGTSPAYPTSDLFTGCNANTYCADSYATLLTALSDAKSGSIKLVNLMPGSVINATSTIVVPDGVTLATEGFTVQNNPNTNNYTQMSRIVRAGPFSGALIQLGDGSSPTATGTTLEWVWVDGQRNVLGYGGGVNVNVPMFGNGYSGTIIQYNRIMEPAIGAGLQASGYGNGFGGTCSNLQITGNFFTGYTTTHTKNFPNGYGATAWAQVNGAGAVTGIINLNGGSGYSYNPTKTNPLPLVVFNAGGGSGASATATVSASGVVTGINLTTGGTGYNTNGFLVTFPTGYGVADGMDVQCENATISGNQLVDVTDTGITLWGEKSTGTLGNPPNHPQHSLVENNTIVQAGNSINAMLLADPISALDPVSPGSGTINWYVSQWSCFSGAHFNTNTVWSGPDVGAVFGIESGAQAFFPSSHDIWMGSCPDGTGPEFSDNTTAQLGTTLTLNALQAYSIQGMAYTTINLENNLVFNVFNIQNPNNFFPMHIPGTNCPAVTTGNGYYLDGAPVLYETGSSGTSWSAVTGQLSSQTVHFPTNGLGTPTTTTTTPETGCQ